MYTHIHVVADPLRVLPGVGRARHVRLSCSDRYPKDQIRLKIRERQK